MMKIVIFLLFLAGCSKDSYDKKEIWFMAQKADPSIRLILPSDEYPAINCKDYLYDCMYGMRVIVLGVEMIAVRFATEEGSLKAALRLDAYYKYNWLFDDISQEPVLIDFVKKVYGASRARDVVPIPKGVPKEVIGTKVIHPNKPLKTKKNLFTQ